MHLLAKKVIHLTDGVCVKSEPIPLVVGRPSLDGEGCVCVSTYHEIQHLTKRRPGEGGRQTRDLKPVRCPCYEISLLRPPN